MPQIAAKLSELGLTLPPPPKPVAAYIPFVRTGSLVFISGQIPFVDGKVAWIGPVPTVQSVEQGQLAARQCALNGLGVLAGALDGDLDRVERIVRLGVFVSAEGSFTDHPVVANGASMLLQNLFGERGRHARAAVGCPNLPLGATVEVEMIAEVRD